MDGVDIPHAFTVGPNRVLLAYHYELRAVHVNWLPQETGVVMIFHC
jgi:hypothetical protein